MSKKLRAHLYRIPPSQLTRIISTVAACNSLPDRRDTNDFIRTQAPEYASIIQRIRRVERTSNGSLVKEYHRTVGPNGTPPEEGYFLAIIRHTRGL